MKLPLDLSVEEFARLLARHYGYRVRRTRGSHMTATLETADGTRFLKTVIPSRKATRDYRKRR